MCRHGQENSVDASMIIACPHCNERNRVPQARLAEAPACGQCHALLFVA
jgi:thioredoxin 2